MTKATPEPWKVDQDPMGWLIISGPEGDTVFYTGNISNDEDCANAELIVDARKTAAERDRLKAVNAEMLAALKGAYSFVGGVASNPAVGRPMRKAIAKAEEESQ